MVKSMFSYLAYVCTTSIDLLPILNTVRVVREYMGVFSMVSSGIPPYRVIDLAMMLS